MNQLLPPSHIVARRRFVLLAALLLASAALAGSLLVRHVAAQTANNCALDQTFGNAGRVNTSFPGGLDMANDVAVQADGKTVVAGYSGSDFALVRYNTDGSLDQTFGVGGRVNTDFPTGLGGVGNALVIQTDGKIVVGGTATDPANSFNSVFALVRYNTNGTLDPTFDTDGRVTTSFPNSNATINDLVIQPDGRIVAAGVSADNTIFASVYALARYNTDGSLDTSFDTDGRVTTDFPGFTFEEAHAVALQTDGKIVAAGLGSSSFSLARYNANGSLDNTFDGDGLVTTAFGGSFEEANALAIQSDGKIIAAGQTALSVASEDNFALARYNTNGTLDTSFDTDGKVITDFGLVDAAHDVVIQTDGKIVAAGNAGTIAGGSFFALARYETNGALDNTFDTDGKVTTDFSGGRFGLGALGVALQTDGKIVAAGDANITGQRDFGVARYTTTGALDTAGFGTGGKVITDFALNEDAISALLVQADGKIVAVGRAQLRVRILQAQDPNFQLARYTSTGALDTSFGANGLVATDFPSNSDDFAFAAALQTDGKIVVVGQTGAHFSQISSADTRFAIARYNANGTLDTTGFGSGGLVTTDFGTTHDTAFAVAIQSNGKIVVAGTNGSDFILARYNADGSLDTTGFGTGGKVTTDFGGFDSAKAVAIQTDGKIVAAGFSGGDFALARYNTDGTLDTTSFGTGGKVTTDFSSGSDDIEGLIIQTDGKLLAAGSATLPGTGSDFALARYNTDGQLDGNFGVGGKTTTDFGGFDAASDVALQSDGKIVAAGLFFQTAAGATGPAAFFALARYNPNGQLDATFCAAGLATTDFFGIDNQANAVAIQPDDKIIAGGFTDTGSSLDFALARYPAAITATVQFSATSSQVQEDCTSLAVTVTRSGDTSGTTTVRYSTADATATQRTDYTIALGTLTFAPDETQKTINLLINEDSATEGNETFTLSLSDVRGASLGTPATTTIQIIDDPQEPAGNAIDDPAPFICQQYHDLLNRQGEPAGIQFYLNILGGCQPGDTECTKYTRGAVTANFFRSPEFTQKSLFVMYLYLTSLGQRPATDAELADPAKNSFERPHYIEFMTDLQSISDPNDDKAIVSAKKDALTIAWLQRAEIQQIYSGLSNAAFVQKLEDTAGVTLANHNQLVTDLNSGVKTRAQVLRLIVESPEVNTKLKKPAFVTMGYFGLLRRDPDLPGYVFHNNRFQLAVEMDMLQNIIVRGFIESPEYRSRFQ
ncbi:MAG: hypothetical protein QOH25_2470 [Acidobacteriota bacterium]|jgi:uncharacterized delta-60 repeat protein|nr:hypothetical protein [Acidobacteriota bacterium]